jgi:acyl phosphate:glycerol-3-phosphate acyltransferase
VSPHFWRDALVIASAYLLGSIPFSYIVARQRGVDVRTVGSGNVGATNVMRSVGRSAGLLAFVLDFLKGAAATALALRVSGGVVVPSLAAIVAVLAHMYPAWLRFRGGKGVATGAGAFLPLAFLPTLLGFAIFGLTLAAFRYVSAASIAGTSAVAVMSALAGLPREVTAAAAASAVLIIWKHRENLKRIANGTENRLGKRRPAGAS